MTKKVAGSPRSDAVVPAGAAALTEQELASVAGGIIIFPKSPPLGWRPPASDPVPPAGGNLP